MLPRAYMLVPVGDGGSLTGSNVQNRQPHMASCRRRTNHNALAVSTVTYFFTADEASPDHG
jgi:hypothetical protein